MDHSIVLAWITKRWTYISKIGNRYTLVFQDYLTKWPEVYAVGDHKATTVAKCLTDVM